MRNTIVTILFLAVSAVVGHFFNFWTLPVPGLEGIETFKDKREARAPDLEKLEELKAENEKNVNRRKEALRDGGGVNN